MASSQYTPEEVRAIVEKIYQNKGLSLEESRRYEEILANYECWIPLLRLFENQKNKDHSTESYVKIISLHLSHLDDFSQAMKYLEELIATKKIDYKSFYENILFSLCEKDNFSHQAKILENISRLFNGHDKISCLEELAFIADKRIFDGDLVYNTYSAILDLDPKNAKSLQYFKTFYNHHQMWDELEVTLNKLLLVSVKNEKYRLAHELSGLLLYQKNKPKQALSILSKYEKENPLDTFSLLYDAYFMLEDWQKCIQCLEDLEVKKPKIKIHIRIKISENYSKLNDTKMALKVLIDLEKQHPDSLEVSEALINFFLNSDDWDKVNLQLMQFKKLLSSPANINKIDSLLDEIRG